MPAVPGGLDPAEVLALLRKVHRPLVLDEFLRLLDLSRRDKKALLALLDHLLAEGHLVRLNGGRWADAGQIRSLTGVLGIQRSGIGFVTPDREGKRPLRPGEARPADIFIPARDLGDAWHGDRVEVALEPPARAPRSPRQARNAGRRGAAGEARPARNPEGRIVRVIERAHKELTVLVTRHHTAGQAVCRPADPRTSVVFMVDTSDLPERPDAGTLLRVRPGDKRPDGLWSAVAFASLGHEDSVAVQEELVRLNHNIPLDFPAHVLAAGRAAAEAFEVLPETQRLAGPREDLRHLPFVTIDGADARDFDDAVCVLPRSADAGGKGWTLWVAIADVTHFVTPGDALDREARERGNSFYFPASVTPMLPETLSNGVCSLRPHEERLVMALAVELDAGGQPLHARACTGLIRSRARLTYEAVQALFDGQHHTGPGDAITPELAVMLGEAKLLATRLQAERTARGGLDLDLPEPRFLVGDDGRLIGACRRERLFSHRLIEAFMLTANEAVARLLVEKGVPFPWRVHPAPDPERVAALFRTLRTTGFGRLLPPPRGKGREAELSPAELSRALNALLDAAKDTDEAFLVGRLVLRSLMQARYSPFADIHFGIASTAYAHFTSPIRRYADVLVHRALKYALGLAPAPLGDQKLLAACEQCNTQERAAQEAEREIARRLGCLLLVPRVGERFAGVICGVNAFGFFVEFDSLPVEAMVRLTTLSDDWYGFDEDRQELVGQGTGKRYRLGDKVTVRLTDVLVGRLEINAVVEQTTGRRNPPSPAPSARPYSKRAQNRAPGRAGRRDG